MFKRFSALTMFLTMFFIPFTVFGAAAGGGEEAAHAEPTGLVMILLMVLAFATLIYMIFLMVTDNG